jgi:hypothetical protein
MIKIKRKMEIDILARAMARHLTEGETLSTEQEVACAVLAGKSAFPALPWDQAYYSKVLTFILSQER